MYDDHGQKSIKLKFINIYQYGAYNHCIHSIFVCVFILPIENLYKGFSGIIVCQYLISDYQDCSNNWCSDQRNSRIAVENIISLI